MRVGAIQRRIQMQPVQHGEDGEQQREVDRETHQQTADDRREQRPDGDLAIRREIVAVLADVRDARGLHRFGTGAWRRGGAGRLAARALAAEREAGRGGVEVCRHALAGFLPAARQHPGERRTDVAAAGHRREVVEAVHPAALRQCLHHAEVETRRADAAAGERETAQIGAAGIGAACLDGFEFVGQHRVEVRCVRLVAALVLHACPLLLAGGGCRQHPPRATRSMWRLPPRWRAARADKTTLRGLAPDRFHARASPRDTKPRRRGVARARQWRRRARVLRYAPPP